MNNSAESKNDIQVKKILNDVQKYMILTMNNSDESKNNEQVKKILNDVEKYMIVTMNNSTESNNDDQVEKILNDIEKYMIKVTDVGKTGIKIANEFGIINKPQNNQNNEDTEKENETNYHELTKQNLKIKNIEDKLNIIEHKHEEIISKIEYLNKLSIDAKYIIETKERLKQNNNFLMFCFLTMFSIAISMRYHLY